MPRRGESKADRLTDLWECETHKCLIGGFRHWADISRLTAQIVGAPHCHVIFATGSTWDTTGLSAPIHDHIAGADASKPEIVTPDQYVRDRKPVGKRIVVIDHDAYKWGRPWRLIWPKKAMRSPI